MLLKEKGMAEKNSGCGCSCGGGACGASDGRHAGAARHSTQSVSGDAGALRPRQSGPEAPVFASANYKLSFDVLRRSLVGLDAWILVLDTKGINVWCAAGKGTFGTQELVDKIGATALAERTTKRQIIVPQLGAPGVAGHEVEKATGFKVIWGPVRAADIKAFLANSLKAEGDMRRVRFNALDRVKLIFVEGAGVLKYLLLGAVVVFAIAFFTSGFQVGKALQTGVVNLLGIVAVLVGGTMLTPLLLPWIPGRSFSLKGLIMGSLSGLAFALLSGKGVVEGAAWVLMAAAASSFFAMGFTGASTYTNLSGTIKEMRRYVPVQIGAAAAGVLMFVVPLAIGAIRGA
jgi:hypothetical protein